MSGISTDSRLSRLDNIPRKQLAAPVIPRSFPADRRNIAARQALQRRISDEFDEMPGTSLTLAQATRLFGTSMEICGRILVRLVSDGRLRRTPDGRFRLRTVAA